LKITLGPSILHNKFNETSICQNIEHNEFVGKSNDAYMCSLLAPKEWCEFIGKVKIRKLQLAWPPTMTQWRVANTFASRLLFSWNVISGGFGGGGTHRLSS
jgi:hypothetical protein